VIAKDEGTYCFWRARRRDIADHHEFLPVGALALEPIAVAAGTIGPADVLRDNPFATEPAEMLQKLLAISREMRAVAERSAGRRRGDHLLQNFFALKQRQRFHIMAIGVKKTKYIENDRVVASRLEGILKRREIGDPVAIFNDRLAVEDRIFDRQSSDGFC
jgi:hypothetical protein